MQRIQDYYKWERLDQWKNVTEQNQVTIKKTSDSEVEPQTLQRAIQLLIDNCFPSAIVCCIRKDRTKVILATPIWNELFLFLNNQKCAVIEGEFVFFKDLPQAERRAILEAEVLSMWLKE